MDGWPSGQSLRRITLQSRGPDKSFGLIILILIPIRHRTRTTHIHTATTPELVTVSSVEAKQSAGDSLNGVPFFRSGRVYLQPTPLYYPQAMSQNYPL
jgi:hypothetical protein